MMHRTEPTRLQALALQLSEKVASLVENNERIMEMKSGNYFAFQKQGKNNFLISMGVTLSHEMVCVKFKEVSPD